MSNTRNTQSWLIEPMVKLGFIADVDGNCQGYAYMAVQAILVDDINKFMDRTTLIIQLGELDIFTELVYKKTREQYQLSFKESVLTITDKNGKTTRLCFITPLFLKMKAELEGLLDSIPAFLQGVSVYQNVHSYAYAQTYKGLFAKEASFDAYHASNTLVLSDELQRRGGLVEMNNFCGRYDTFNELLTMYVLSFMNVIRQSDGKISFSIVLESGNPMQ